MHHAPLKPPRTLEDYWTIARRRRWWLILPLFLGWAAVLTASWFIAPKYRSETVVIVEPQRAAEQYVTPNISADVQERLQSMMQQILSRTRLQGVIDRFHLYGYDQKSADDDGLVQQMRSDIKIELVSSRPGELSAFKISYSAPSPLLAQQVTNELSSLFIAENTQSRQQMSESTTEFLEAQLQQARISLSKQEERLRDFKSRHLGELPEQLPMNTQVLSGLQSRLEAASTALDEANQQKLYLQSLQVQYQGGLGTDRFLEAATTPAALDEQIRRLKAQLAEMSAHYTPSHPDVRHIRENLKIAERLQKEIEADPKGPKPQPDVTRADDLHGGSPLQQITSQQAANELRIASREHEVRRLEKQIQDYQARLNLTPLREQELAEITADYNQAKSSYESLLNKETQSEIATNLQKGKQGDLFRVIDPPNLPRKPYKPDRLKYSLLGLLIGIFLSFGLTALMETVDARIWTNQDLREVVTTPILAGIPLLQTESEEQRRRWYGRLEAATASAIALAITTITLITYYRG